MQNTRTLVRSAFLVAIFVGLIHLAFSAVLTGYALVTYHSRMFDVRRILEQTDIPNAVSAAISTLEPNDIVAIGSSFTFGYPFDQRSTFPAELTREGLATRDLGVLGTNLTGIHDLFLCQMQAQNLHVASLIIEIPLVNDLSWLPQQPKNQRSLPSCLARTQKTMFTYFLQHPIGIGWFGFLFDPYRNVTTSAPIDIRNAPHYFATDDQFVAVSDALRNNISIIYDQAKTISSNVYMFVTPIYLDGVSLSGNDRDSVSRQFKTAQSFCRETAGDHCFDTSDFVSHTEYFYNLTHANPRGSAVLGRLFATHFRITSALLPAKAD